MKESGQLDIGEAALSTVMRNGKMYFPMLFRCSSLFCVYFPAWVANVKSVIILLDTF